MKQFLKPRIFLPLLFLLVVVALLLPRSPEWEYNYTKGSHWQYSDLVAEFDFPILKTEEQIIEEMQNLGIQAIPFFRYSDELVYKMLNRASKVEIYGFPQFGNLLSTELVGILEKGIIADDGIPGGADLIYIQKDKRIYKTPASEVYTMSMAREKLIDNLSIELPPAVVDSVFYNTSLFDIVTPNLIFDQQSSDFIREETKKSVSPTSGYMRAGTTIISKGEIVTAELIRVLDSYKKEYRKVYDNVGIKVWIGNGMLALILVMLLAVYLYCSPINPDEDYNKYLYLLLVFLINTVMSLVFVRAGTLTLWLPVTAAAWLIEMFFGRRMAISAYALSLTPLLLMSVEGSAYFLIFLAAGMAHAVSFKTMGSKWKLFLSAFISYVAGAFAMSALLILGFIDGHIGMKFSSLAMCIAISLACYPLVYLYEKLFNLTSGSRLRELAETSSEILRKLEQSAPGSFQHSLQVMNMSDAVARAIGADPDLVRAGAMYHDIGKMNNPMCFIENETILNKDDSPKYHDALTPLQSAQDIIKHVDDGIATAQKNHLPQIVSDFILTHHGTSSVSYFYDKHLKGGGSTDDLPKFCYNGVKPRTLEQVIVMICDALEASSRTLKNYSEQSVSDLVEYIFSLKFKEGQFSECEVSLKELETMRAVLKKYLAQLHHERIAYPKNRNK